MCFLFLGKFAQFDGFYLFSSRLVDSRDIVELQLKQLDCELIIRKKEALPQPPSAAPVVMMQSPSLPPVMSPTLTAPAPTPSGQAPAAPTPAPSLAAPKSTKSLLPPLKCPMAGTFYRSPSPGEPPFVKVNIPLMLVLLDFNSAAIMLISCFLQVILFGLTQILSL